MHCIFYICQILILPALSILISANNNNNHWHSSNLPTSPFSSAICIAYHDEALAIASMGVFSFCRGGRYSGEGSKGAFAFQPKYKSAHPHLIITLEQLSGQAMLKTFRFLILEIQNLSGLALSVATCHQCNWLWIGSFLWWMFLRQIFYRCASPFSCKNRVGGKTAAPAVSAFNPSLLN